MPQARLSFRFGCIEKSLFASLDLDVGIMVTPAFKTEKTELFLLLDASASMDSIDKKGSKAEGVSEKQPTQAGPSRTALVRESLSKALVDQLGKRFDLRWFTIGERLKEYDIPKSDWTESFWESLDKHAPRSQLGTGLRERSSSRSKVMFLPWFFGPMVSTPMVSNF